MLAGVFGVAYFVYGKKQAKLVPMVAGVPALHLSLLHRCGGVVGVVGIPATAAPFVIDY
jgi:hypothetical protein